MSETIRYSPWAEPGAAAVTFLPKMTEHREPGGVNWITRKSSPAAKSASSRHPRSRRSLRAIDVGDGDDDDLELHVDRPRFQGGGAVVVAVSLMSVMVLSLAGQRFGGRTILREESGKFPVLYCESHLAGENFGVRSNDPATIT